MSINLRPATDDDFDAILTLNAAAVPHVNLIDHAELTTLARQAFHFSVATAGDRIAGFLLSLPPGADYPSLNYQWFTQRYAQFVYVDRIVVADDHHGSGIGGRLYAGLEKAMRGFAPSLTCEVNLLPANPGSLAFHDRLGFAEVGQQETEGGAKRVSLMHKAIANTDNGTQR